MTDQKSRSGWEKDGGLDIRDRGRKIARSILDEPTESYIPVDIDKEIRTKFNILLNR